MPRPRTRAELVRIRDYGLVRCSDQCRHDADYEGQSEFWKIVRRGTEQAWVMVCEKEYLEES